MTAVPRITYRNFPRPSPSIFTYNKQSEGLKHEAILLALDFKSLTNFIKVGASD